MNKKKYQSLPPDIKETFDNLCGEYRDRFALMWNALEYDGKFFVENKGVEYIDLSPEEIERWAGAVEPVIEQYVPKEGLQGIQRGRCPRLDQVLNAPTGIE